MKLTLQNKQNQSSPIPGLGLVAEGGGQRGVFTAGVLDALQISKFNPFEILIGTSAGAQNIASYVSQQKGYAYTLIDDLTRDQQFFKPWRLFSNDNVMDLDWYFKQTENRNYLFDQTQANKNASNRKVRFTASLSSHLTTRLIDPVEEGWLDALKYTSAIPYLYDAGNILDGGVTAPIPVHEAYKLGAKKILVIRTNSETKKAIPKSIRQLRPLVCNNKRCPNFIKLLDKHESTYRKAERFINRPPKDVTVITLKPTKPLSTKVLGSSKQDIIDDYKHGLEIGKAFIERQANELITH